MDTTWTPCEVSGVHENSIWQVNVHDDKTPFCGPIVIKNYSYMLEPPLLPPSGLMSPVLLQSIVSFQKYSPQVTTDSLIPSQNPSTLTITHQKQIRSSFITFKTPTPNVPTAASLSYKEPNPHQFQTTVMLVVVGHCNAWQLQV